MTPCLEAFPGPDTRFVAPFFFELFLSNRVYHGLFLADKILRVSIKTE